MLARLNVGDYEAWKARFDADVPRAREASRGWRVFRSADDPGQVFVQVEFASVEDARAWYESEAYAEARELRQAAANTNAVILAGFPGR